MRSRCIEALAARDGAALIGAVDGAARARPVGRRRARGNGARCCSEMAVLRRCPARCDDDDPDTPRSRAPRGAAAGRRDPAALQHRPAWPRRAGARARRVQRPGDGAAAPARVRAGRRERAGDAAAGTGAAAPAASPRVGGAAAPAGRGRAAARARRRDAAPRSTPPRAPPAATSPARPSQAPTRRRSGGGATRAASPPTLGRRWCGSLVAARARSRAMVRELAMQAECVASSTAPASRSGSCASSARTCARRRCASSCRRRVAAGARRSRCGSSSRPASAVDTPARRDAAERDARQAAGRAEHPRRSAGQALMAQYKTARIVPGSVKPQS